MRQVVVVDDERTFIDVPAGTHVTYARHSSEGLTLLRAVHARGGQLDELWLDHDLGEDDTARYGFDTIMPVVLWLEQVAYEGRPLPVGRVFVHTQNPAAVPAMLAALRPGYPVTRTDATRWFVC